MKFFDFRKCHIFLNGVRATGWAEGDDVFKCERLANSVEYVVGADGKMAVSFNANKAVKFTLKFLQTSPTNALLSKVAIAQDNLDTFVPIMGAFQDGYRQDIAATTVGVIEKQPDITRGAKINVTEWTLIFERGDMMLGDPAFAGLLTAAAEALGG